MKPLYRVGLDIGSTTVKTVIIDNYARVLFKSYQRHYANIKDTVVTIFTQAKKVLKDSQVSIVAAGSGAIDMAKALKIPFVQEVIACTKAIETIIPQTDVAIELGGEDAKITYLSGGVEQRMNGSCAGGTGAFIDQMATLLKTDAKGLNDLARDAKVIYPIASRCGVFAKTDIQPLLNEGARQEDIAASIFQAIVNQTISGLAQGRPIRGKVAFLGGPLAFMPQLRKQFIETLHLAASDTLIPPDAQYFVAMGAALCAEAEGFDFNSWYAEMQRLALPNSNKTRLAPLFENKQAYQQFAARHQSHKVRRTELQSYHGRAFLGIDAGSTTTKLALIDENGQLLYTYYANNGGNPLLSTLAALQDLYQHMPDGVNIGYSVVTGYGEKLLQAAFKVDDGEIETVAHYKAAKYFLPDVDFIIDIGGQDMKCLQIRQGVIQSIMLNEACSSGCGSFIETFAKSLNMPVLDFAQIALTAKQPVDLGTRCTVFMNSRVKQAQREGATIADISAGIAVSVVKNALYKVIRIQSPEDIGQHIVVQGGTFYNEAVLRAFEMLVGREVIRPDIAGVMGAFGAALLARERYQGQLESTIFKPEQLQAFTVKTTMARCGRCGNNCLLTINRFADGSRFISGNRCEKGSGSTEVKQALPNAYRYKYQRVFAYQPLEQVRAERGSIGIPRALNMYEDYPFWFTFFTALKYHVVLSAPSSRQIYEKGMDSIASESVCYPAKLVHGHIMDLIDKHVSKIFYPCVPYNVREDRAANNHYNCPIVTSYPETIKANIEVLKEKNIKYLNPFVSLNDPARLIKMMVKALASEEIPAYEIEEAANQAYAALAEYKEDVRQFGETTLETMRQQGWHGIVLAGRPYHIDPEINHGIADLIEALGLVVLSEDAVAHLAKPERPLRVVDQWAYHTRLYAAASYVARQQNLDLVQLNSFGCGLDAVTTDQVKEILERSGSIYTVIKIDEINTQGAVRIRLRSLLAAINERKKRNEVAIETKPLPRYPVFSKAMRKTHTILAPQMSPIHFQFFQAAAKNAGYQLEVLPSVDRTAIEVGLKYVHNDACYPTIIVVGQMIKALQSGKYNLDQTSLIISQTGGGCRATNYIAFIRKALVDAGYGQVPVVSLNASGLEKNSGFKLTPRFLSNLLMGVVYGDALMQVLYRTRPYEKEAGSANRLYEKWVKRCQADLAKGQSSNFKRNLRAIVTEFDQLALKEEVRKPRVGVVGEILVKYHPTANNNIVELLEAEGAEAVVPGLMGFFLYAFYNHEIKYKYLLGSWKSKALGQAGRWAIEWYQQELHKALKASKRFTAPFSIREMGESASHILSLCNQTGEGWLLTAEMIELIEAGVENVICLQPFACLPNHITGKGMIRALKQNYPFANIVPIDCDPGMSEVNQLNRIKLMLSTAFKNMRPLEGQTGDKKLVAQD